MKQSLKKNMFLRIGGVVRMSVSCAILILALMTLASCASNKTISEHHTHHIKADTMAVESQGDRRIREVKSYVDSLFEAFVESIRAERILNSEEQETVAETIITAIDSQGRQQRTEQRTTTRTQQWQEHLKMEKMAADVMREFSSRLAVLDSQWQQRLSAVQSHWEDSLSAMRQQTQQSGMLSNMPWYHSLWGNVQFFGFLVVVVIGLWLTRRLLRQKMW